MRVHLRGWRVVWAVAALVGVVVSVAAGAVGSAAAAGAGGSAAAQAARAARAIGGGTAYWAEQPLSAPDYIFPLISDEYYSNENVDDFQTLLYRPLYWFGDQDKPGIDYALSLGDAPVYSDGDRVVTVTLKPARWSDDEPVDAREVIFWINLLKANRDDWASYVPGGFPDNVTSYTAAGPRTVKLTLNRAYNPTWFTDNELSQITPLPLAWDRTNLDGCPAIGTCAQDGSSAAPDLTLAGARAVYRFLNAQAKDLSSYASSPVWRVVDGPWRLQSLTADGQATFVPNPVYAGPGYDGPDRPHLHSFVELPFTSETSEFTVLKAGSAKGDTNDSSPQISVGYVPDTDAPQATSLKAQGYRLTAFYPYGFDYFEPNFNNPSAGPIFQQLYFRQAFQHLVDQSGWIRAFYQGLGVPTYSPVPAQPANPYADAEARVNPYPFSVSDAQKLLAAHGWTSATNGGHGNAATCTRPGTGREDCGAGIPRGKQLRFTLLYPTGLAYTDSSMLDLQAVARKVGIVIDARAVTSSAIDSEIAPCAPRTAACSWQIGQFGSAWVFAPDHYPSGEEIFQTGALGNVGSYSNPKIDALITATTTATSSTAERAALNAYANAVRTLLPDFWQPSPGTLITAQSNLAGTTPNAYGFISPEEWYFTK